MEPYQAPLILTQSKFFFRLEAIEIGNGHSEPRRINAGDRRLCFFFYGDDSNGYNQLYKTDGTANGSTKVTNFSNGTELSEEVSQYCKCIYGWVIGNTLYFQK